MKKFILICVFNCIFLSSWSQDIKVRVAEVQFHTLSQDGINLSGTYGEGVVGSESKEGIVIVHGFYSGIISDSITSIHNTEPITGLTVFPNPAMDGLILVCADQGHPEYQISLISASSVLLQRWIWSSGDVQVMVELGQKPAGMYFITVKDVDSGRLSSMQIVKQ